MINLKSIQNYFENKIEDLQENQSLMEKDICDLKDKQHTLEKQIAELATGDQEIPYLFMLPDKTEWFSGRESELENLQNLLNIAKDSSESTNKIKTASVCGLGGTGKTSLAAEYAHRRKDYYSGGVFWFSGEDKAKFANSVDELAGQFGTVLEASTNRTLTKILEVISKIEKPWLIVLDDMDEYKLCSNIVMLLSGSWKRNVKGFGHIIITTRRKPKAMVETVRNFKESQCLQLDCFSEEDGVMFVFKRTGLTCDQHTSAEAANLVETLGGLPLALEQACAYISQLSCSLSLYLEQYKKCALELLDQHDASSASLYESQERLAVRTTWLVNFDYVNRSKNGKFAVRFLHACAFFSPADIQSELINSGKPPIEDNAYRDYVETPLGSSHILKLLTDFSLFRKNKDSSLTVHQLVQEVIRDKLEPEGKLSSLVDAIRMLSFAFSRCASPDDILTGDINIHNDRASTLANNPSRFFSWKKFCMHAQEILTILSSFADLDKKIILPETAKIIYECAIDFNVSSKIDEAIRSFAFAQRIVDLGRICPTRGDFTAMFPREIPMPESLRRYIYYSCVAPSCTPDSATLIKHEKIESKCKVERMHVEGNRYFMNGNYMKAVQMYSSAMAEINSFDPKLLCDRGLAFINLKQYKYALDDSENYLLNRPKCWLGFSVKALALQGLNEIWEACSFAALAFYYNRNIFSKFQPFKNMFSSLERRIFICDSQSDLSDFLLNPVSNSPAVSEIPGKIILVEPGYYVVDPYSIDSPFKPLTLLKSSLFVKDCILLGVEVSKSSVVVSFNEQFSICAWHVLAKNISFTFSLGNWESVANSANTWVNCSLNTFLSVGADIFKCCLFENCKSPGLIVTGSAYVENCVFSGGECSGVHVRTSGKLEIKHSKLHGNLYGIFVIDASSSCTVQNCDIFDNQRIGIQVAENALNVKVENCRIYQNDQHGIYVCEASSAVVSNNEIFENGWTGIVTLDDGRCDAFGNKIYGNKSGGIIVVPVDSRKVKSPSLVEFNTIVDNRGRGIICEMRTSETPLDTFRSLSENWHEKKKYYMENKQHFKNAICNDNNCYNNESPTCSIPSGERKDGADFCSYCRKRCTLKCGRCFITKYCNKKCQKNDWNEHKKECRMILERSTVSVTILTCDGEVMSPEHTWSSISFNLYHPGLEPKNSQCAPKPGKTSVVKILAGDETWHSDLEGPKFTICDETLTINGYLDTQCYPRLYKIVLECGVSSTFIEGWKKKFFWAKISDEGNYNKLRVFVTTFPPSYYW